MFVLAVNAALPQAIWVAVGDVGKSFWYCYAPFLYYCMYSTYVLSLLLPFLPPLAG